MSYEVSGFIKFAEEDIFADGCQPDSAATTSDSSLRWSSHDLDSLIGQLMAFVGCESSDNVIRDACDEPGRLDIQVYEGAEGTPASEAEMALWKEGKKRLWLACYSFYVESVIRTPAPLAV